MRTELKRSILTPQQVDHKALQSGRVPPGKWRRVKIGQRKINIRKKPNAETNGCYHQRSERPELCAPGNEDPHHDGRTEEEAGVVIGHSQAEGKGTEIGKF